MKMKLVSAVVASMVLASASMADANTYISVGYGNVSIDGTSTGSVTADLGFELGEKWKNRVGMQFAFSGENKDWSNGQGNLMDIYYALGYEVIQDVVISAKVGYGIQDLGSTGSGSNSSSALAGGFAYGALAKYEINEYFDISTSYTHMNLNYLTLDYGADIVDVSLAVKF